MLKIHGVPISVHTRKTIVAAAAKGIAYENDPVIPFDPPANWRALSPTGLIPAISHDGYDLADSAAICAYLERLAPHPSLYPAEPQALGRALWLERYASDVLFREVVHPLFFQSVIRPHILQQGDPDGAEVARVEQEVVPSVFGYLEGQASTLDGELGIAAISIASNLVNYGYLGFSVDAERYPRLAAAFAASLRQTAFQSALAAERPFVEQMGLDGSLLDQTG